MSPKGNVESIVNSKEYSVKSSKNILKFNNFGHGNGNSSKAILNPINPANSQNSSIIENVLDYNVEEYLNEDFKK